MLHRPPQDPAPDEPVHRISAAPHRHSDDMSQRINRYLLSMAVRTVCVVLVVVVDGPLRWFFAVGAIGLPYVAVILANASSRPRDAAPQGPTARPRGSITEQAAGGPETVTVTYGTPLPPVLPATPEPPVASTPVTVSGTVLDEGPGRSAEAGAGGDPGEEMPRYTIV